MECFHILDAFHYLGCHKTWNGDYLQEFSSLCKVSEVTSMRGEVQLYG